MRDDVLQNDTKACAVTSQSCVPRAARKHRERVGIEDIDHLDRDAADYDIAIVKVSMFHSLLVDVRNPARDCGPYLSGFSDGSFGPWRRSASVIPSRSSRMIPSTFTPESGSLTF